MAEYDRDSDSGAIVTIRRVPMCSAPRNGPFVTYKSDGHINLECNYLDGKLHGEYTKYYWHCNSVDFKCSYLNGKKTRRICKIL